MRAELTNLSDCAVPFQSRAAANSCWYYITATTVEMSLKPSSCLLETVHEHYILQCVPTTNSISLVITSPYFTTTLLKFL